ncbi:SDR family oxidoreductase [Streptomyces minutiscleroticus]|uniref:Short-chain dehydrogenase n=1 Tax=Streptomyces minutiscleroticus TaxID=68238 RepID=A0A918KRH0_9ACTN|nr:SDR family oxidoreductase [Streptomyces minutiscleroticus]GGX72975.1 short-chain dehydrogenase [Streptomyces minutiscleroticus]
MKRSPLSGRVVVVTGAARGVGAAVARTLASRGARVALLGLEEPELADLSARLGGRARHWCVDVTDEEALGRTAERIEREWGTPSAVVANAGVAESGPFLTGPADTWRRIIEVNLLGSAATARAFLPALLRTEGYYLQVASLAALAAAPMMSAYCASKSGVEAMAHALRGEVAHLGVDVGVAYLSWTDTDMIRTGDRTVPLRELRRHMPWPATTTHPVDPTAERLVRGIERRSAAVFTPPWLRLARLGRGVAPGIVARRARQVFAREVDYERVPQTGLLGPGGSAARRPSCGPTTTT